MVLSEREANLIKSSWKLMEQRRVENPLFFYESFFTVAPEARKYFPNKDFKKLGRKFDFTLDFIVSNCHQLEEIQETIEDLGRIHIKLKIEEKFYSKFNDSLLRLVSKMLDDSKEVHNAWSKALNHISEVMQNAPDKKENKFQQLLRKVFG